MASRLARSAVNATRLRPSFLPSSRIAAPTLSVPAQQRYESNVPQPQQDPKKTAQTIIDALPGSNLASKTAILSAGTGVSVWAISNELYTGPMYKEWSENTIGRIKDILYTARKGHAESVKARIEDVKPLSNVVEITKGLFEVSKETAQLEAQAYELEQKTALATEAKNVLDSWVRYEGQVKQRQQRELADTVIAKVNKEFENPKFLQQILTQSVADVEKALSQKAST